MALISRRTIGSLVSQLSTASSAGRRGALAAVLAVSVAPAAAQAAPTLTGSASGSVVLGGTLRTTVTLSGTTAPASGTVSFSLFGPADATCASAPLSSATSPVTGDGVHTSPTVTARLAGSYRWVVSYSGDANNAPVTGSCGDPDQTTVVTKAVTTTTASASGWVPLGGLISASVELSDAYRPGGRLALSAYLTDDCSGPAVFSTGEYWAIANGIYFHDYAPTATGFHYWLATYTGDGNNEPSASTCGAAGSVTEVVPAR